MFVNLVFDNDLYSRVYTKTPHNLSVSKHPSKKRPAKDLKRYLTKNNINKHMCIISS